tara:strand:- start:24 stop:341 length:318 start_codon:yes stop_codon:yes gene_type:complete
MDSRFYDENGNFAPIYYINNVKYVSCVPIIGIGRPQSDVDVLVGGDGNFLTVVENMETGKAEMENSKNWDASNNQRFLELYGPISSRSYRFNRWLDTKDETVVEN